MGSHPQAALVVLANTVLTNFALIKRPDLLLSLWPNIVCTTQEVYAEYRAGVEAIGLPAGLWNGLPILTLSNAEIAYAVSLSHRLGAGERSCVALAVNRSALLASDDKDARQFAIRAGLAIIGSVGILVRCVQKTLIPLPDAQNLLDMMIDSGYYSPIQRLDEFFL